MVYHAVGGKQREHVVARDARLLDAQVAPLEERLLARLLARPEQLHLLEPIGGEGMGLALRSAELAAEAISTQSDLPRIQQKLQRDFIELWRWRRMLWRGVAMLMSRPILCELAVDVMNVTNVGERLVSLAKASDLINESASLQ